MTLKLTITRDLFLLIKSGLVKEKELPINKFWISKVCLDYSIRPDNIRFKEFNFVEFSCFNEPEKITYEIEKIQFAYGIPYKMTPKGMVRLHDDCFVVSFGRLLEISGNYEIKEKKINIWQSENYLEP